MSLANNLQVAQEAIEYVNNRLPLPSPNWPGLSSPVRLSGEAGIQAVRPGGQVLAKPQTVDDVKNTGKQVADLARSGRCGEKSTIAFTYVQEKGYKVAYVYIVNGNHEFVVVGGYQFPAHYQPGQYPRHTVQVTAVPNNIFGPTAVICDPWFRGGYAGGLYACWTQFFTAVVQHTKDPQLANRDGWDTPGSLATQLNPTYDIEILMASDKTAAAAQTVLPPMMGPTERMAQQVGGFFQGWGEGLVSVWSKGLS